MAEGYSVKLHGLKDLQRALKRLDSDISREIDDELKDAATVVRDDAANRLSAFDVRSSEGLKVRMRGFGRVEVRQTRRKVSGLRPDFGSLIMRRALLPARAEHTGEIIRRLDNMLDRLGRENGF